MNQRACVARHRPSVPRFVQPACACSVRRAQHCPPHAQLHSACVCVCFSGVDVHTDVAGVDAAREHPAQVAAHAAGARQAQVHIDPQRARKKIRWNYMCHLGQSRASLATHERGVFLWTNGTGDTGRCACKQGGGAMTRVTATRHGQSHPQQRPQHQPQGHTPGRQLPWAGHARDVDAFEDAVALEVVEHGRVGVYKILGPVVVRHEVACRW